MAKTYDVLVVGAGPAGFLAARAAGENGLDVALLEKKSDPTRLTRACGQSIIAMNEYYFGNIVNYNARDKRICFSTNGFSFKYDGGYCNLYAVHSYTPNGHKIQLGDCKERRRQGDLGRVGITFDKEIMFRCMLEEAKACSVEVFPGITVEKVISTADSVIAEGSGQSFEGRYLIAADGVNSRIAEVAGFNKDRTYYCNLYALSIYLSGVEPPEPDIVIRVPAYLKEGPASMFIFPHPTGGNYNLTVITLDPRVNLEIAADYFMKEAYCAPWFKNAKKIRTFSAVCNCYAPIAEPYKDRVLITGDAGSTQELENTGAMVSGWKAGQAISTAVKEQNLGMEVTGIAQYLDWWKRAYINYYDHQIYMRSFTQPYILNADEVDFMLSPITEPLPACWNPYTVSNAMAQGMAKALPIIQKERPDILQKVQKAGATHLSELLAELTKRSKPVS